MFAELGGSSTHLLPGLRIALNGNDRIGDRVGVSERHQHPPPVGKKLLGIGVGGREHGLARPNGVGERARCDLLSIEIGRDVDVHRGQVLDQLLRRDKAVDKPYVVGHAKILRQRH